MSWLSPIRSVLVTRFARRRAGGESTEGAETRRTRWLDAWIKDLSFARRSLAREGSLSVLVVLTLGFGIGATTALVAVVKQVLLAPLPYDRPEGIAVLWSAWKGFDRTWLSYDEYEGWKADIPAFQDVAVYSDGSANLTGGDQPEQVRSAVVGANLFGLLGVSPSLGRGFTADEDRPGGPPAAVISHELWSRRFGADAAAVGGTIELDGVLVPLVGVMPEGFRLPLDFGESGRTDLYRPLATDAVSQGAIPGPAFQQNGGSHGFYGLARLAEGATAAQANAQLRDRVTALVDAGVYQPDRQFQALAVPVGEQVSGEIRGPLVILLGAVSVVLLIACANVAGLLLVRGERRRRELAVRVALGAERHRLTRLLFAEAGVLAAAGAVAGLGVAGVALAGVRRFAPAALARVSEARLDPALLAVALAIGMLTALLTGLLPALQATRVSPADELRDGGRGASAGRGRLRWRHSLVTAEVALAVVLATGAGLLVRSVSNLLSIDPGFDPRAVLTMRISTPSTWYGDAPSVGAFWARLERDVSIIPGVRAVGSVRLLPLATEMGDMGVQVEGFTPPPGQGAPADWQVLSPGAFRALGLRVREGRPLADGDDAAGSLAIVVNQQFVESYLPGRQPLGVEVRVGGSTESYRIVGVAENARHNSLTSMVKPGFYVTPTQFARAPGSIRRSMSLVVRTDGDPAALVGAVRSAVRKADPRLPVSDIRTMEEIVDASIAAPRFAMQLLFGFGVMALALSAIGIFGVVSHAVAIRQQEFGIRSALGARPAELLRMALVSGLRQTASGIGIGVVLALLVTRVLGRILEGVAPTDPLTFGTVVVVTALVTVGASLVPAGRAARADPSLVLRAD